MPIGVPTAEQGRVSLGKQQSIEQKEKSRVIQMSCTVGILSFFLLESRTNLATNVLVATKMAATHGKIGGGDEV